MKQGIFLASNKQHGSGFRPLGRRKRYRGNMTDDEQAEMVVIDLISRGYHSSLVCE